MRKRAMLVLGSLLTLSAGIADARSTAVVVGSSVAAVSNQPGNRLAWTGFLAEMVIAASGTIQNAISLPDMSDPTPGEQLPGSDVTFMWAANGTALKQWYVRVGLQEGTSEFAEVRITNPATTQLQVTGLPTDGITPVFVELSHRQAGVWTSQYYEYRAFGGTNASNVPDEPIVSLPVVPDEPTVSLPAMADPQQGSQLSGSDVTFMWAANGTELKQWYVRVGLQEGTSEFAEVRITNPATTQLQVTGLPSDGVTPVFVELSHRQAGVWTSQYYEYRASNNSTSVQKSSPMAMDDVVGPVSIGGSLTFSVVANDTDGDGGVVANSVVIVDQPALGTAAVEPDGQITYMHDGTVGTVQDVFSYAVADDDGGLSNTAIVTITPFSGENVPPKAVDDTVGPATVGDVLVFSVTNNDSDSDGLIVPNTVEIASGPQHGTASVDTNGNIIYQHNGTVGIEQDSLMYTVLDNNGSATNEAVVTITPFIAYEALAASLFKPLDISFHNASWSGNAFDVLASATFTHSDTNAERNGELFYDGDEQWKIRFVADLPGRWVYTTSSTDQNLNDHSGAIFVDDSQEKGFVRAQGDKWIRSATGQAFVPQYVMASTLVDFAHDSSKIENDLEIFVDGHGFTGFHIRGYCQWFKLGTNICSDIPIGERDPDPQTFQVIEDIITQTSARGGTTHIWMYGDDTRGQNPSDWGLNGSEDKRMQRYLAARLGALPGWTIGYGYDVSEWASPSQVEEWYGYLNEKMMYPHLTSARGDNNEMRQHSEILSYSSYDQHTPSYDSYRDAIVDRPEKPSFSEDRFRIAEGYPAKDYTSEETRRGMWHSAMAGGVANIWGNLQFDSGGSYDEGSRAYPNQEELKLFSDFMSSRFSADVEICSVLSDGLCLQTPSQAQTILYKEDASDFSIDLRNMPGASAYVAMETTTGVTVSGTFEANQQLWTAPSTGDWVIDITYPAQ